MSENLPQEVMAQEIVIKDKENPHSLVNMVNATVFASGIMNVPDELFLMDESELRRRAKPTQTDEMLKQAFWNEYDRAMAMPNQKKRIDMAAVWSRCSTREYFFKTFTTNSFKMAWLLVPPPNYVIMLDMLLNKGLQRLGELLDIPTEQPIVDKETGKIIGYKADPGVMKTIASITKDLDMRKTGAVPTKNVSVVAHIGDKQPENIDHKIKELEAKLGVTSKPQVQEAEYREVKPTD